jgi:quercetin dioxygenase-like cupin family protein
MPDSSQRDELPTRPARAVFRPQSFVPAADGTEVCAFLNPHDARSTSGAHPGGDAVGMAAGRLAPGVRSTIHVHPALTQITYVTAGTLTVLMRNPEETGPSRLQVTAGAAALTEPGTLLQLCNETDRAVEVLYVSTPAYVLETAADGSIRYEDALMLGSDWTAQAVRDWGVGAAAQASREATSRRAEAAQRIAERAGR